MAPFFVFGGVVVGLAVVIWVRMLLHDRARPEVVVTTLPVKDARNHGSQEVSASMLAPAARETSFLAALRASDPAFQPAHLRDRGPGRLRSEAEAPSQTCVGAQAGDE